MYICRINLPGYIESGLTGFYFIHIQAEEIQGFFNTNLSVILAPNGLAVGEHIKSPSFL